MSWWTYAVAYSFAREAACSPDLVIKLGDRTTTEAELHSVLSAARNDLQSVLERLISWCGGGDLPQYATATARRTLDELAAYIWPASKIGKQAARLAFVAAQIVGLWSAERCADDMHGGDDRRTEWAQHRAIDAALAEIARRRAEIPLRRLLSFLPYLRTSQRSVR